MSRDITGTNPQGSNSGPRPDQSPHKPLDESALVLDLSDGAAELAAEIEDDAEPERAIDELGAAVEGDAQRPIDKNQAPSHVHSSKSRTM